MIGFNVVDTENGDIQKDIRNEYVIDQTGWLSRINLDDIEVQVNSKFKAVPSITIDGVEYYHGMVLAYKNELYMLIYVISENYARWELNLIDDDNEFLYRVSVAPKLLKKMEFKGNPWHPEYRCLLPLLEV